MVVVGIEIVVGDVDFERASAPPTRLPVKERVWKHSFLFWLIMLVENYSRNGGGKIQIQGFCAALSRPSMDQIFWDLDLQRW